MKAKLNARFEIKTTTVGPNTNEGEVQEARILNRVIRITPQGWEYEADQRHADLIVQETGASGTGTLSHPGGDKKGLEEEASSKELVDRRPPDSEPSLLVPITSQRIGRTYNTPSRKYVGGWPSQ